MKKRAREHVNQVALDRDENETDEAAKTSKGAYSFFFFFFCCKPFVASFQMAYREPRATQATQRSRPAKRDCDEEGDKFERNLKKIGNRNLTCKLYTWQIGYQKRKKKSYIYNVMWLFWILHHKTLFFSLAFPMCKRGFSSMKLLNVQTGRLGM